MTTRRRTRSRRRSKGGSSALFNQAAVSARMRDRCGCGKVRARDEAEARALLTLVLGSRPSEKHPVRFYTCDWGNVHWTSQL